MTLIALLVLTVVCIPIIVFLAECIVGVFQSKARTLDSQSHTIRTAILMPAHNESAVIANTLKGLTTQVSDADEIVVIADNCSDDTAEIARSFNVTVLERFHETERGKGYALDHGLNYLKTKQEKHPEIVTIVDADCLLEDNALNWLKQDTKSKNRAVQARYLMLRGEVDRVKIKISEFAFLVKNLIRLRGLARMGMPVPLVGTGMAFPWETIIKAKLATGDIVEDMRLGVELVEAGRGATYCDEARVISFFPQSEEAERTQRERWEHGHLDTLKSFVPRLLKKAVKSANIQALGMALDLSIPPLSLLIMVITAIFIGSVPLGWLCNDLMFVPEVLGSLLLATVFVLTVVWFGYARHILSMRELIMIPVYIFSKVFVYIGYMINKQTKWIRTNRD